MKRSVLTVRRVIQAGIAATVFMVPALANSATINFAFDWGATNQGFVGTPISGPVNELKYTSEAALIFNGTPFAPGTTFTDYVVLRIDQLFVGGNLAVTPYGPGVSMETTVLASFTGHQVDPLNYVIDGVSSFRLIYDGPTGGYTQAIFSNLSTFADGQIVEGASFVNGNGVNGALVPDGAIDLRVGLVDLLNPSDFEVAVNGSLLGSVTAITNANNALCGANQTCAATTTDILAQFGVGPNAAAIHTRSDGSIEKTITVPEPGTLGLLGLALGLMGFVTRRRSGTIA